MSRNLPNLSADANSITFQGFSAGCQFSHMMQVIHSTTIKGTGLYECGPYGSQFADFSDSAMTAEVLKNKSIAAINAYSSSGKIDDTSNLQS